MCVYFALLCFALLCFCLLRNPICQKVQRQKECKGSVSVKCNSSVNRALTLFLQRQIEYAAAYLALLAFESIVVVIGR